MKIGAAVMLISIGAILTFAVTATVAGVDIDVIGIVLMAAGGVGLIASLYLNERGTVHSETVQHSDGSVESREKKFRSRS